MLVGRSVFGGVLIYGVAIVGGALIYGVAIVAGALIYGLRICSFRGEYWFIWEDSGIRGRVYLFSGSIHLICQTCRE